MRFRWGATNRALTIEIIQWVFIGIGLLLLYKFIERERLIGVINQSLPAMEGGVLEGIICGSKEGMSKDFYNNLKNSGLVHLVVASGSNLILLSRIVIDNLAGFLGRKKTIVLGLAAMWGYASMVEWQPPIVRACLFLSIKYLAQLVGRKFEWKRALGLTAAIMVMADVEMIVNVSFWLSMIAFMSVSIGPPRLEWWKRYKNNWLVCSLNETIWVSLWLTPLMCFSFGKISWVAPLTNLLVIFLVEGISLVGVAGVLVGLVWLELGKWILWLLIPAIRCFEWVVGWGGGVGGLEVRFNWWMMMGSYLLMIYLFIRKKHVQTRNDFLPCSRPSAVTPRMIARGKNHSCV